MLLIDIIICRGRCLQMGYAFLINVYIILAQADGVLEIFYDVLALQ